VVVKAKSLHNLSSNSDGRSPLELPLGLTLSRLLSQYNGDTSSTGSTPSLRRGGGIRQAWDTPRASASPFGDALAARSSIDKADGNSSRIFSAETPVTSGKSKSVSTEISGTTMISPRGVTNQVTPSPLGLPPRGGEEDKTTPVSTRLSPRDSVNIVTSNYSSAQIARGGESEILLKDVGQLEVNEVPSVDGAGGKIGLCDSGISVEDRDSPGTDAGKISSERAMGRAISVDRAFWAGSSSGVAGEDGGEPGRTGGVAKMGEGGTNSASEENLLRHRLNDMMDVKALARLQEESE